MRIDLGLRITRRVDKRSFRRLNAIGAYVNPVGRKVTELLAEVRA